MNTLRKNVVTGNERDTNIIHLTRDEKLQRQIVAFVKSNKHLPEDLYQFKLSRLLAKVECTDVGNAIRFAARYGRMFRYIVSWERWMRWNGKYWEHDEHSVQLNAFAEKTASYIEMEADLLPTPQDSQHNPLIEPIIGLMDTPTKEQAAVLKQFAEHDEVVKAMKKWAKGSRSDRATKAMISRLISQTRFTMSVSFKALDAHDELVNFQNGTLNMDTLEFSPHNAEHLITCITEGNYRADYLANPDEHCPKWAKFHMTLSCENAPLVRFLQQLDGQGMVGGNRDQVFPVHHGSGGNGKSVKFLTIRKLFGGYAAAASRTLFTEKQNDTSSNEIAGLVNCRYLVASEPDQGAKLAEGLVKTLTGDDPQTVRFLFKEYFTFDVKFNTSFLCNHKPLIKGNDNGIWRRVKLIPWVYNFEQDPERKPVKEVVDTFINEEADGILAWCIKGYRDLVANGLQVPAEVAGATKSYRDLSDVIGNFLKEKCRVGEPDTHLSLGSLYDAFKAHMETEGHQNMAKMSKPNFGEQLQERGIEKHKTGVLGWHWLNIRMLEESETNDVVVPFTMPTVDVPQTQKEEAPVQTITSVQEPSLLVPETPTPIRKCMLCESRNRPYTLETYHYENLSRLICTGCYPDKFTFFGKDFLPIGTQEGTRHE